MQLMDNSAKFFSPNVKSLVLDIYTSTSYTAEVIFFLFSYYKLTYKLTRNAIFTWS